MNHFLWTSAMDERLHSAIQVVRKQGCRSEQFWLRVSRRIPGTSPATCCSRWQYISTRHRVSRDNSQRREDGGFRRDSRSRISTTGQQNVYKTQERPWEISGEGVSSKDRGSTPEVRPVSTKFTQRTRSSSVGMPSHPSKFQPQYHAHPGSRRGSSRGSISSMREEEFSDKQWDRAQKQLQRMRSSSLKKEMVQQVPQKIQHPEEPIAAPPSSESRARPSNGTSTIITTHTPSSPFTLPSFSALLHVKDDAHAHTHTQSLSQFYIGQKVLRVEMGYFEKCLRGSPEDEEKISDIEEKKERKKTLLRRVKERIIKNDKLFPWHTSDAIDFRIQSTCNYYDLYDDDGVLDIDGSIESPLFVSAPPSTLAELPSPDGYRSPPLSSLSPSLIDISIHCDVAVFEGLLGFIVVKKEEERKIREKEREIILKEWEREAFERDPKSDDPFISHHDSVYPHPLPKSIPRLFLKKILQSPTSTAPSLSLTLASIPPLTLTISNVTPVLISSSFLDMPELTDIALSFLSDHLPSVLSLPLSLCDSVCDSVCKSVSHTAGLRNWLCVGLCIGGMRKKWGKDEQEMREKRFLEDLDKKQQAQDAWRKEKELERIHRLKEQSEDPMNELRFMEKKRQIISRTDLALARYRNRLEKAIESLLVAMFQEDDEVMFPSILSGIEIWMRTQGCVMDESSCKMEYVGKREREKYDSDNTEREMRQKGVVIQPTISSLPSATLGETSLGGKILQRCIKRLLNGHKISYLSHQECLQRIERLVETERNVEMKREELVWTKVLNQQRFVNSMKTESSPYQLDIVNLLISECWRKVDERHKIERTILNHCSHVFSSSSSSSTLPFSLSLCSECGCVFVKELNDAGYVECDNANVVVDIHGQENRKHICLDEEWGSADKDRWIQAELKKIKIECTNAKEQVQMWEKRLISWEGEWKHEWEREKSKNLSTDGSCPAPPVPPSPYTIALSVYSSSPHFILYLRLIFSLSFFFCSSCSRVTSIADYFLCSTNILHCVDSSKESVVRSDIFSDPLTSFDSTPNPALSLSKTLTMLSISSMPIALAKRIGLIFPFVFKQQIVEGQEKDVETDESVGIFSNPTPFSTPFSSSAPKLTHSLSSSFFPLLKKMSSPNMSSKQRKHYLISLSHSLDSKEMEKMRKKLRQKRQEGEGEREIIKKYDKFHPYKVFIGKRK
ncbi:hypothetical protein ADUPG1_006392 [Aduncisulcus paluster]|uniref:Myb-like domain-containing protein n=1 Tax=Aduncisulcus paluster TaxID=2918883 RepID=A0ABQ5KL32_9EUKA|nr:hypothetical protein ADUPG1_006392 [Aduncisulcus paluster]